MSASDAIALSVVLPVKDGAVHLAQALAQVADLVARLPDGTEVLAVDDGSVDGTATLLEQAAHEHPWLRVVTHDSNRGKGAALKTGVAASHGRLILTVDADATFALDTVEDFLAALDAGAAAAIGNRRDARSRFLLNPKDFAYVGLRHGIGWAFGVLARILAGVRVADSQAGFKAYRGDVARELFPTVDAERFGFDVEILALLQLRGHRIAELPVVCVYRDQPSTVHLVRDGLRMLRRLVAVRLKVRRLRRSGVFADHTRGDYQRLAREQGHPVQRFWHRQKWPLVEELLAPRASDRVLEVGGGSSEIGERLAERTAFVCGTDLSPAPLAFLSGEAGAEDGAPRVHRLAADMHALPFADASFDAVVVLEVIEHVPRAGIARYLGELRRVLAPGGRLLLTTPNYSWISSWRLLEWLVDHFGGAAEMGGKQHICRFVPSTLRAALEQNGWGTSRLGSVYHLSPFLAPMLPQAALRLFGTELRRGGTWGPILYAVAQPTESP